MIEQNTFELKLCRYVCRNYKNIMYTNRLYTVLNFEQVFYSSVLDLDFRKHPVYKIKGRVHLNNLMINLLLIY